MRAARQPWHLRRARTGSSTKRRNGLTARRYPPETRFVVGMEVVTAVQNPMRAVGDLLSCSGTLARNSSPSIFLLTLHQRGQDEAVDRVPFASCSLWGDHAFYAVARVSQQSPADASPKKKKKKGKNRTKKNSPAHPHTDPPCPCLRIVCMDERHHTRGEPAYTGRMHWIRLPFHPLV